MPFITGNPHSQFLMYFLYIQAQKLNPWKLGPVAYVYWWKGLTRTLITQHSITAEIEYEYNNNHYH